MSMSESPRQFCSEICIVDDVDEDDGTATCVGEETCFGEHMWGTIDTCKWNKRGIIRYYLCFEDVNNNSNQI